MKKVFLSKTKNIGSFLKTSLFYLLVFWFFAQTVYLAYNQIFPVSFGWESITHRQAACLVALWFIAKFDFNLLLKND